MQVIDCQDDWCKSLNLLGSEYTSTFTVAVLIYTNEMLFDARQTDFRTSFFRFPKRKWTQKYFQNSSIPVQFCEKLVSVFKQRLFLDVIHFQKQFDFINLSYEKITPCKFRNTEHTVGLNMCVTLKKMPTQADHIFDTFEYF